MKYTVDYFIKKFERTKEEDWCIGKYTKGSRKCVMGHCGCRVNSETEAGDALDRLFEEIAIFPEEINDGNTIRVNGAFPQPTPKQRILAALHKIKEIRTKKGLV